MPARATAESRCGTVQLMPRVDVEPLSFFFSNRPITCDLTDLLYHGESESTQQLESDGAWPPDPRAAEPGSRIRACAAHRSEKEADGRVRLSFHRYERRNRKPQHCRCGECWEVVRSWRPLLHNIVADQTKGGLSGSPCFSLREGIGTISAIRQMDGLAFRFDSHAITPVWSATLTLPDRGRVARDSGTSNGTKIEAHSFSIRVGAATA
jgi:hypothetical protein